MTEPMAGATGLEPATFGVTGRPGTQKSQRFQGVVTLTTGANTPQKGRKCHTLSKGRPWEPSGEPCYSNTCATSRSGDYTPTAITSVAARLSAACEVDLNQSTCRRIFRYASCPWDLGKQQPFNRADLFAVATVDRCRLHAVTGNQGMYHGTLPCIILPSRNHDQHRQ